MLSKIASVFPSGKALKTTSGKTVFIPESLRESVKAGQYLVAIKEHFDRSTDPESGELVDAPFDRNTLQFAGEKEEVLAFSVEDKLLEVEAQGIVNQAYKKAGFTKEELDSVKVI